MASVEEMKRELQALIDQSEQLVRSLESVDGVTAAAQLARFDFASLLLAIVSLLLVFGGLFAFGFVRGQATEVAKSAADDVAEKRLTELLGKIERRLDDYAALASKAKQPSDKPSVASAKKATGAKEFDGESDAD